MKTMKKWISALLVLVLLMMSVSTTAFAKGKKGTVETVTNQSATEKADAPSKKPKSITIEGSEYVAKGKKIVLTATVSPGKASQKVTWKTSNKKVATVSSSGVVKGIKAGTATITAVSKANSRIRKTWKVKVMPNAVSSITINAPGTQLDLNGVDEVMLTASASPVNAAQSFTWKTSDDSVAVVDDDGIVTAVEVGEAVITATAIDGSKKSQKIKITVVDSSEAEEEEEDEDPTAAPEVTVTPDPTPAPTVIPTEAPMPETPSNETDGNLFTYSNPKDGKVSITGFVDQNAYPVDIVIPKKSPSGYEVTAIAADAFKDKAKLNSVTFQSNVQTIGIRAFKNCELLRVVTLAEGLVTLEGNEYNNYGAFCDCPKLTSITIPSTVKMIGGHCFYGDSSLTSLTIRNSSDYEMTIGNKAFVGTRIAGALTIPSKVSSISSGAFSGISMTSLTIEQGTALKTIGEDAFNDCNQLLSVTIPGNVTTISARAFKSCDLLESVTLSEGLVTIGGNDYNNYGAFCDCPKLTSITIPSTVKAISGHCFYGDSSLTSLTIRNSSDYEMTIGNKAFVGTRIAGALTIPSKVSAICSGAFSGISMTSLTIEQGTALKTIGEDAFNDCNQLLSVTIPGNVTTISTRAFKSCDLLESVTLSEGLVTIGGNDYNNYGAFSDCPKLTSITIPSTVKAIGGHCFYGDRSLSAVAFKSSSDYEMTIGNKAFVGTSLSGSLYIPSKVKGIYSSAFSGTLITSVTIESGMWLEGIGDDAFNGCKKLTSVTIPGNVKTIGIRAFQNCDVLDTVTLNEGLVTIGGNNYNNYGAFSNCPKLTSMIIPSTVKNIGGHAFYNDSALTSIVIRNSVDEVTIGNKAFDNCPGTPIFQ